MRLFENKVVVVTGVGPGLGTHLSVGAAREGADVVMAARTETHMNRAAGEIRSLGRRALPVPTDVTDPQQCARLVERALVEFGRIDVLINSAFISLASVFEDANLDEWKRVMDVNCFGYLRMAQSVLPTMKRQGGGAIVMVNTMLARTAIPSTGAYAVSKGAVSAATRALAKELAPLNIHVNQVYLGYLWGPAVKGMFDEMGKAQGVTGEDIKRSIERDIPIGHMPTDEECSHTVLFLASDYAKVVVGASIDVNGGQLLGI